MNGDILRIGGRDYIEVDGRLRPAICGGYEYVLIAGAAAAVIAAGVSAYGAYQSGKTQQAAAKYNVDVANQQAEASRAAAEIARSNREEELRRQQAAQRARLGASGVLTTEGSPLLVQMESARQAQLELERITYAGEIQAGGFQSQGILQGFYGRQARRAGTTSAGASLLSGVGSGASLAAGAYRGQRQSQAP